MKMKINSKTGKIFQNWPTMQTLLVTNSEDICFYLLFFTHIAIKFNKVEYSDNKITNLLSKWLNDMTLRVHGRKKLHLYATSL